MMFVVLYRCCGRDHATSQLLQQGVCKTMQTSALYSQPHDRSDVHQKFAHFAVSRRHCD